MHTHSLMGVARLMRLAAGGTDLAALVNLAALHPDPPQMLMGLSFAFQLVGNREAAIGMQQKALDLERVYRLTAPDPAAIRLLALVRPGDLQDNTPLDFLLENSDVELIQLYVSEDLPLPAVVPEHDLLFVAIGESSGSRPLLEKLGKGLADWPKPVLNPPEGITALSRDRLYDLLSPIEGLHIPETLRMSRDEFSAMRDEFPVIARPLDSHAGADLEKLEAASDIGPYLSKVANETFYVAKYVDYRSPDGLYRKYRIAMIGGRPYPCHLAISGNWMVSYRNSGMDESEAKRAEEAEFMTNFAFGSRHRAALSGIAARIALDYFVMDCGETRDGRLLLFELDNRAYVHDMDPPALYPYKRPAMRRLFGGFRGMLGDLMERRRLAPSGHGVRP